MSGMLFLFRGCNRPFSSCSKPLFQCEAMCETIDMKIIFYSHANIILLHKKGFALTLVLKVSSWNSGMAY